MNTWYKFILNALFSKKSGELRVWEGTDGVGTCYCSLGRSPFVRALLPLSFPDRPVPVSPILIKDFCLQGTGNNALTNGLLPREQ